MIIPPTSNTARAKIRTTRRKPTVNNNNKSKISYYYLLCLPRSLSPSQDNKQTYWLVAADTSNHSALLSNYSLPHSNKSLSISSSCLSPPIVKPPWTAMKNLPKSHRPIGSVVPLLPSTKNGCCPLFAVTPVWNGPFIRESRETFCPFSFGGRWSICDFFVFCAFCQRVEFVDVIPSLWRSVKGLKNWYLCVILIILVYIYIVHICLSTRLLWIVILSR